MNNTPQIPKNEAEWSEAFEKGRIYFQDHQGLSSNPYTPPPEEYEKLTLWDAFHTGWLHEYSMR